MLPQVESKTNATDAQSRVEELKERVRQSRALSLLDKQDTLKLRLEHVGPSCALFFQENPLKIVKGRGQYLYDELGNEYLDCINNVAHVGHGNTRVAEAVGKQLHLLNTNSRFLHDNLSLYAKRLVSYFPDHLNVCYLVNSGSEANDLAIRLARAYTKHKDIVCVDGAYHGNLSSTMAISPYKSSHIVGHTQPKWAHVAPLPSAYRIGEQLGGQFDDNSTICGAAAGLAYGKATEELIEQVRSSGRQVAALFVESMISCGGQFPLPSGYLRHLQAYLHNINSLLVCDEVQTGFGRSGKQMWAFQLDGDDIKPDIVTVGKPIGNGFPIAAVVTSRKVALAFQQIGTEYFNTFGGNPASCAAALAVLDELESRNLMQQADKIGTWILNQMLAYKQANKCKLLGDVRGHGYFLGFELVECCESRKPTPECAQFVVQKFRDENIIMSTEGKYGNVLKFKPPMVFDMDNAREFVRVLQQSLNELEASRDLAQFSLTTQTDNNNAQTTTTSENQLRPTRSSHSSASSSASSSWFESSCESER